MFIAVIACAVCSPLSVRGKWRGLVKGIFLCVYGKNTALKDWDSYGTLTLIVAGKSEPVAMVLVDELFNEVFW